VSGIIRTPFRTRIGICVLDGVLETEPCARASMGVARDNGAGRIGLCANVRRESRVSAVSHARSRGVVTVVPVTQIIVTARGRTGRHVLRLHRLHRPARCFSRALLAASRTLTRRSAPPSPAGRGSLRLEPEGLCSPLPILGEGSGVRDLERSESRPESEQFAYQTAFLMKSESMAGRSPLRERLDGLGNLDTRTTFTRNPFAPNTPLESRQDRLEREPRIARVTRNDLDSARRIV
jgi:hypothetical protein